MEGTQFLVWIFLLFFAAFAYKGIHNQTARIAFPAVRSTWENFEPSGPTFPGEDVTVPNYDLLRDSLKGFPEPRQPVGPNAQECYAKDYTRKFEKAASYGQETNNYKRAYPDSCSAPNHDLIFNFYQPLQC